MKKYEIYYIIPLRKKRPYSELLSPNTGKYGPEKLRIWILFMQCTSTQLSKFRTKN